MLHRMRPVPIETASGALNKSTVRKTTVAVNVSLSVAAAPDSFGPQRT